MSAEERRLDLARERGREAVASLAREACLTSLPLTCRPPPPAEPFAYGDLVPLGFLLRAVNADAHHAPAVGRDLEDLLRARRQGLLWPYHTGTLVTCIDSALVLQGLGDPAGVEALEIFADGRGGYFPQLCSEEPERGKMVVTPRNRHWCQPEYATTCLVAALRAHNGLRAEDRRRVPGAGLREQGRTVLRQPLYGGLGVGLGAAGDPFRNRVARAIGGGNSRQHERGRFVRPLRHTDIHRPGDPYAGIPLRRRRGRTPGPLAPGRPHDGGRPLGPWHPVLLLLDRTAGAHLGGRAREAHARETGRTARLAP